ncbi:SDR family oxidoreductase [Subtercola vilae]|uniref:SDR family oxidoreductase n=1 Tax=Subtercola vilae TaxID=2056433 RepID=A0A4T2BZ05_9MICO|nr:SDR family oxidoreductase [Subtercola vilae]TIH34868.1 SDR family oxidoreductase [Subtercola vilae]
MRVFITGASGWIGSAVTDELLANGYQVLGLARSDSSAEALEAKGAEVLRGDLDDLEALRSGASSTDATIHLANKHDWANPAVSNKAEREAVETIGEALAGSNRKFLLASGVAGAVAGRALTENDASPFHGLESPRGGSENRALEYVEQGVGTVSVRFAPTVHGAGDQGFVKFIVDAARANGFSGYVGDGANNWPAVHRSDAARVVRLGLEKAAPGTLLHAIGEQAIPTRTIAEAIGRGLNLPVRSIDPGEATAKLGMIGGFFAMDIPASSALTQQLLGWTPTGPTLVDDLDAGSYFA